MAGTKRNWCFTVANDAAVKTFGLPTDTSTIRYAIWQLEKTPTTGRPHVQGYLEFTKPYRVAGIKDLFKCPTMHLEGRLGTRDQARDYCRKRETQLSEPFEFGEFGQSRGARTDLANMCEIMKTGGMRAVVEESPATYVKYSRGLKDLEFRYLQTQRSHTRLALRVVVLWGETGTGKTRCAIEYARSQAWYKLDMSANGSTLWWDGYQSEDVLIVDDFYGWVQFGKLLNLLDIYPVRLDVKCSHAWANWTKVIITSNKPPEL